MSFGVSFAAHDRYTDASGGLFFVETDTLVRKKRESGGGGREGGTFRWQNISSVSAKERPFMYLTAIKQYLFVGPLHVCQGKATNDNNFLKKSIEFPLLLKNSFRCSGMCAYASRGPTPWKITSSESNLKYHHLFRAASGSRKTPRYKIWVNIFFHLVNGLVFLASSLAMLIDFSARAALW